MTELLAANLRVFLIALGVSYVVTPLIGSLARFFKVIDRPAKNKFHRIPTPRLGGLAIFAGYFLALYLTGSLGSPMSLIVAGGAVALLLGALDDIFKVPALVKLAVLSILTVIMARHGLIIHMFGKDLFYLNLIVTFLWIVGVTSAFNAVDNMDGLAAGLGAIASATFFVIAVRTGQWGWAPRVAALCGALLGFLRYNFNPAKIFMGDSGSFFLGFTLAAISIKGDWSNNAGKASIIPLLVLAVPIFDITYSVVRRWMDGTVKGLVKAITFCATDHLSHRLIRVGLSERLAVLFIYLIAVCVSIGAVILQGAAGWDAVLLFLQFILIFIVVFILLGVTKRIKG